MILGGERQKILFFRKRRWLDTMPAVMAAGKAGGTTIVTISNVRKIIVYKLL